MTTERNRKKREKVKRKKANNLASASTVGFKKFTDFHWRKSINGMSFDYWPSTKKGQFNGVVYHGIDNMNDFEEFLKKQGVQQ